MDHKSDWDTVVDRLQQVTSLAIVQYETGAGITEADLEILTSLDVKAPPPPMVQFYKSSNGVKLLWNGILETQAVQGSINILSLFESSMRVSANEGGEPLEGVLWNPDFPPNVLRNLKRMAIFEAIAGQSASLTYYADDSEARLFLVEDDRIRPIVPDFDTTIGLLQLYAGAYSLRNYLTYKDWRKRIERDQILRQIAAL